MSSSADKNTVPHSRPIPIGGRHRRRSESMSDSSSSDSSTSPASPLPTPISGTLPHIDTISPSSSPILSLFLSQSPKSPSSTFPFRRNFGPPVVEDEEAFDSDKASPKHARRASTAWAGTQPPPVSNNQQDRAAGLLRRLSLGGSLTAPSIPVQKPHNGSSPRQRSTTPPDMKSTSAAAAAPTRKTRRSNTLAPGTQRPPRAPSPMGERILKGHFDGFN